MKFFGRFLSVRYTRHFYCIAAVLFALGCWMTFWYAPKLFSVPADVTSYASVSPLYGFYTYMSFLTGLFLIFGSVCGAYWAKNELPKAEQDYITHLAREKRKQEENKHRALLEAEKRREREAYEVERSRQNIAYQTAYELKRKEEARIKDEQYEADKAYQKQKATLKNEILLKQEAMKRKLELEALTRKLETAEQDAQAAFEAREAQRKKDAEAAWAAAHPPPLNTEEYQGKLDNPDNDVSKHLTDKQIEQIALKAFRRISTLSKPEQAEAWQEWEETLSTEYDPYIGSEIMTRVNELRGVE